MIGRARNLSAGALAARLVGLGIVGCMVGLGAVAGCGNANAPTSGFGPSGAGDDDAGGDDSRDATMGELGGGNTGTLGGGSEEASAACSGLACQQQSCAGGATTSISGTVFAPNGTLPIYNAIVYVPNAPLSAIDAGISCDQCGTLASGDPITTTLTDSSGHFTLTNVPVGSNIPLVVQLGKWRRQTTIATVTACMDNPQSDPNLTRLPKNQTEGSMPHIALTTGGCDSVGCMLGKLGVDTSEFGVESDGPSKAIHVYSSSSGDFHDGLANTKTASSLWSNLSLLETYDIGIFSCECSEGSDSKGTFGGASFQAVTDYINHGGRIFTTDFQYTWYKYSPDPNLGAMSNRSDKTGVGTIQGGAPFGDNPLLLNETFPKGLALGQWLTHVFPKTPLVEPDGGALENNKSAGVKCDRVFDNVTSLNASTAQLWSTSNSSNNGNDGTYDPRIFTVNTPVGVPVAQQCGKGVHIDAHITEASQGNTDFVGCNGRSGNVGSANCYPNTCTDPLQEDEAMFAFFFFDLASCIQNESAPPTAPPPTMPR